MIERIEDLTLKYTALIAELEDTLADLEDDVEYQKKLEEAIELYKQKASDLRVRYYGKASFLTLSEIEEIYTEYPEEAEFESAELKDAETELINTVIYLLKQGYNKVTKSVNDLTPINRLISQLPHLDTEEAMNQYEDLQADYQDVEALQQEIAELLGEEVVETKEETLLALTNVGEKIDEIQIERERQEKRKRDFKQRQKEWKKELSTIRIEMQDRNADLNLLLSRLEALEEATFEDSNIQGQVIIEKRQILEWLELERQTNLEYELEKAKLDERIAYWTNKLSETESIQDLLLMKKGLTAELAEFEKSIILSYVDLEELKTILDEIETKIADSKDSLVAQTAAVNTISNDYYYKEALYRKKLERNPKDEETLEAYKKLVDDFCEWLETVPTKTQKKRFKNDSALWEDRLSDFTRNSK
jgi:hypothetical protein